MDYKELRGVKDRIRLRVKRPADRRSLSRSASRALDVLELFGEMRRPLRAIDISKTLVLHPSTTNQLLKTMVESAHLTFEGATKTYMPSPRLARFGGWMFESYGADERLRRLVRELQIATGELVTLTTPNDLFMQILDLAGSDLSVQRTEPGLRASMFGSSIGTVYLSTLPDVEIARLALRARINAREAADMIARVGRIRRDGVADGPAGAEFWSVATSLPVNGSSARLVLALAGPKERVRKNLSVLRCLLRAAVERWVLAAPLGHATSSLRR